MEMGNSVPVSTHGQPPPITFQSHCALHLACNCNWMDYKWRWRLLYQVTTGSYFCDMLWLCKWGHWQTLRFSKLKAIAHNNKMTKLVQQCVKPPTVQILTWKHRSFIRISCTTCENTTDRTFFSMATRGTVWQFRKYKFLVLQRVRRVTPLSTVSFHYLWS